MPSPAKPISISAQVDASGTAVSVKVPTPKAPGFAVNSPIGIALPEEAENIDALASGGLEGNADRTDECKSVREYLVVGAPKRARAGDLAAVNDPSDGVDVKDARACRR